MAKRDGSVLGLQLITLLETLTYFQISSVYLADRIFKSAFSSQFEYINVEKEILLPSVYELLFLLLTKSNFRQGRFVWTSGVRFCTPIIAGKPKQQKQLMALMAELWNCLPKSWQTWRQSLLQGSAPGMVAGAGLTTSCSLSRPLYQWQVKSGHSKHVCICNYTIVRPLMMQCDNYMLLYFQTTD